VTSGRGTKNRAIVDLGGRPGSSGGRGVVGDLTARMALRAERPQLEVQRRLDGYIGEATPMCMDFLRDVERVGREVLEPLWEIVSPIRAEWLTSGRAA
jgi:hypothetical protein